MFTMIIIQNYKHKMQELLNVKAAGTYNYHSALKG
jgi:hypothetical protein